MKLREAPLRRTHFLELDFLFDHRSSGKFAGNRGGSEGQDAGADQQPGGWLGNGGGRGGKDEAVYGEWSDVDGVVRVKDIDVIGAVVVDVSEAGSYGAGEIEEIAQCVNVDGVGIGEDKVVVGDARVGPERDDAGEGVALAGAGDAGQLDGGVGGIGQDWGAGEGAADDKGGSGCGAGGGGADGEGIGVGASGECGRCQKGGSC